MSCGGALLLGVAVLLGSVDADAQRKKPKKRTVRKDPTEEPPGAAPDPPSTMEKIATATDVPYHPKPGGHLVKFNLQDADLAELVNHISGMTGKRFIYGSKIRKIEATVVSPEPVTLNEAYEAFLSILQVNGMTVVPHGRFLKIVDSAGVVANGSPLYSRGAPIPNTDNYITRIYRTRFVSPDEAMQLLMKFKSKEGDISTYPSGNLMIITDTGAQVRRMVRILEEVDVGGAGEQMWIEPVNHGSAEDMAKRINDLFEVGEGGSGGLIKVISDEQTNSLIVVGTDESYEKLLQVMKRLDTRAGDAGSVHVLPLQHAVADELAKTLQQMLTGRASGGKKKTSAPAGGEGQEMFEGDIIVTPDKATNSLVVSSSPRDFAQLRMVVERLDQPRRQVFIEAVIMDVGVTDTNDLGFSWHGGTVQGVGGGEDSTILGGFNSGQSMAFPLDPNSLTGFAAGIRGPDLPGTNNQLLPGVSIPAFGVVMNALASSGRGNVLATPHIIATDNVPAEINVGENIPLQTNVGGGIASLASAGAAGAVGAGNLAAMNGFGFNAPREDVGNKIKVTPHINESDQVRLEIEQESSAPGTPTGNLGVVPITKRTAKTTVVVKDQQTVVIGGLMRDEYITSKDKVPILGDIPILGVLFRKTHTSKKKTNLLLVLTPHVIREQADLRRIFERKMQERQEFIDRYFVFATDNWDPHMDYSRANGLVEDIRQSYFDIDDRARLEEELRPRELHEHAAGEPIDLPTNVKVGPSRNAAPRQAPAPAPPKARMAPKRGSLEDEAPELTAELSPSEGSGPRLRVAPPQRSVTNESFSGEGN
jgi:general secretion pathway protein D